MKRTQEVGKVMIERKNKTIIPFLVRLSFLLSSVPLLSIRFLKLHRFNIETSYRNEIAHYLEFQDDAQGNTTEVPATNLQVDDIPATERPLSTVPREFHQQALDLVETRRLLAREKILEARWGMRGIGYLYSQKKMILASYQDKPGHLIIQNVYRNPDGTCYPNHDDAPFYSIYVRIRGPEIFAGLATPVVDQFSKTECQRWEYRYPISKSGAYGIDIKLLYFNATSVYDYSLANGKKDAWFSSQPIENYTWLHEQYPFSFGFQGFKFYSPVEMCAEICARIPECQYWVTPPFDLPAPKRKDNGCQLFFLKKPRNLPTKSRFWRQRSSYPVYLETNNGSYAMEVPFAHGLKPFNQTYAYLGCGWSYWMSLENPCLDGDVDDSVPVYPSAAFTFYQNASDLLTTGSTSSESPEIKDLCLLHHEWPENHKGRWVRGAWPGGTCEGSFELKPSFENAFNVSPWTPSQPYCWHRDDFRRVGLRCFEMNCNLMDKSSRWISPLHNDSHWYGTWQHDNCDYVEFTDRDLQQCINERKIRRFGGSGASLYFFLRQYYFPRWRNLTMYDGSEPGIRVYFHSLRFPHLKGMTRDHFVQKLHSYNNTNEDEEHYWFNSVFMTSEREIGCRGNLQIKLTALAREVLEPKGWKMVNMLDLSKAFMFDTATQYDGLHVTGPPWKMLVTKFFHHVCTGTSVIGTSRRVGSPPDVLE